MSSRRVVIVGGGIAGVALAWRLAPGSRVVLLEREQGLGYHATGRSAAEWSLVHAEGLTRSMTAASGDFFIAPPQGFSDLPLLRRRGNVVYARPGEGAALADLLNHARSLQPDIGEIAPRTAAGRAPFLDPSALEAAFWDPLNGEIEVDALMTGCRRAAAGAVFQAGSTLLGTERRRGGWDVSTSEGRLDADVLVIAAGPWSDEVALLCGAAPVGLEARRRTAVTFDPPDG